MKSIQITSAPAALAKLTHAAPESAAQDLAERIAELEATGHTVTHATSARLSVPTCYRSAYKLNAPAWVYNADSRTIALTPAKLENRSRGATIPPHILISGSTTPAGYRALRKAENEIDLIPAR
jgi:hypothetical protein